jgi:flagellar motor switch protein FliN
MSPTERPSNAGATGSAVSAGRGDVTAHVAEFTQLGQGAAAAGSGAIDMLDDIPITLTATLGQTVMTVGDILKLGPGATVGLDREVTQPVELMVGGKVFARGEVVVVNDRFAIRIKDLGSARLGGAGEPQ